VLNDWLRKAEMKRSEEAAPTPGAERNERKTVPPDLETLDQIYERATVKPPRITYGIQKVTDMADSTHLEGMSPEFKRKALLMALHAAGTDEGEVLNDLVIRQRALKEYEDSFLERLVQFEEIQLEQNRQQQAELDKITQQYKSRIQQSLDDVEKRYKDFRAWQESKRQDLQRFTEAASLCVPQENAKEEASEEPEPISNVMTILRATGTSR
jgi:hypothetical protein